jgi:putative transposase
MDKFESLSHDVECKYHVVFIPKCRRKANLRAQVSKLYRSPPGSRVTAQIL